MCAMKEMRVISDDQNSNECLKQLNQEIALLSELSHPNIVQYYGSKLVWIISQYTWSSFLGVQSINCKGSMVRSQNR
ncbi:PREDICTED: mitogen-activated protein kinase kinase kinase YODA-like [Populus euphratica]|uniref:Mitogen-activated protein kinase kinase kinase YODA-like n=1 Tax=Populus euphratica TaxID=75702 RepID=A0AAJ6UE01_POPEU|nr:PREDICTED: mitogen-activated protein kinase kinase kinase YODA-like [Populus euphratica]